MFIKQPAQRSAKAPSSREDSHAPPLPVTSISLGTLHWSSDLLLSLSPKPEEDEGHGLGT